MPLLHQSVTTKSVVPDLPIICFSQPHNLCRSLCRSMIRQPPSANDEPPRPSQSCGKSRCELCFSLICSSNNSSTGNNKNFKFHSENTTFDSKTLFMLFLVPSIGHNTWARVITLELA